MNNYREITENYGVEIRKKVRHYEKTSRKIGRYNSHLHFNLQCKHNDIIPNHSKILGKWKDQEERDIIRRAEKALLNKKIGEVAKKRKQLKEKGDQLRNDIKGALPDEMYAEIMKVNEERKRKEEEKSRRKQRDKYYRLKHGMKYSEYNAKYNIDKGEKEKKTPRDNGVDKSKWVINVSKRELTSSERAILEKGAGFAIANKDIPYDDYVVATQEASRWLPKGQGLALNAEITEILKQDQIR